MIGYNVRYPFVRVRRHTCYPRNSPFNMVILRVFLRIIIALVPPFTYIRHLIKIRYRIWYYSGNYQRNHNHRNLYQIKVVYIRRRVKGMHVIILIKPLI